MIKSFINTILFYLTVMIMVSMILIMRAEAGEVVIGVAPGEAVTGKAVFVSESTVKRPRNEELDKYLSQDLQEYIWQLCKDRGLEGQELKQYYACMIGLAEGESTFSAKKTNQQNSDGSCDRGLYQVNQVNVPDLKKLGYITCADDLYNAYSSAKCGEYLFWKGYKKTGYDEQCYTRYLYGDSKWRSNKYTQRVWKIMQGWYQKLWK